MSKLPPHQLARAQALARARAETISELLALDGVPVDAQTASAFGMLYVWSWGKLGWDTQKIAQSLRNYADNIEMGKTIK